MDDLKIFGGNLRILRKHRGLSRTQLGEQVGIGYKTVANIEAGRYWPSMPVYISLCRALRLGKMPVLGA